MATKRQSLDDLIPDDRNMNKHSVRGSAQVERSLREYGAGRSILVDKDNKIIAGNLTAEMAREAGIEKVLVVETDGNTLVAVKRTDISLDSPQGRQLAVADNRSAEVSLEWDIAEMRKLEEEGMLDLKEFFFDAELAKMDKAWEREHGMVESLDGAPARVVRSEADEAYERAEEQGERLTSPPARVYDEPPKYDAVEREEHYAEKRENTEPTMCMCPRCGETFPRNELMSA